MITRFCPSPTGKFHLGSARTAMFAYAFAKRNNGKCLLRIEDTDRERSSIENCINILEGLEWIGLKFDNGPKIEDIKNGKYEKNYFQSLRSDIYKQHIDTLLRYDKAYIIQEGENAGVTMFRMPKVDCEFNDLVLGRIRFSKYQAEDFAIARKDGTALFHLTVVVDDALSKVNYVIRGNDHTINTHKHIRLYQAFGYNIPIYAHMPLIMNENGEKLSKRKPEQKVLIEDFRKWGFLPSSVQQQIGSLGWSPKDKIDDFDLDYICKHFDFKNCGRSNSKYDYRKFLNINFNKIQKLGFEDFRKQFIQWCEIYNLEFLKSIINKNYFDNILAAAKKKIKKFEDVVTYSKVFLDEFDGHDVDLVRSVIKDSVHIEALFDQFQNCDFEKDSILYIIDNYCKEKSVKLTKICNQLRVAICNSEITNGEIDLVMNIAGKEECLSRMEACINIFDLQKI